MSKFVTVETKVWRDEAFLCLGPDARLMFLWAWSNERAQPSGIYRADPSEMVESFSRRGLLSADNVQRFVAAREQLAEKPLMLYDPKESLVWVVNRARYANRTMTTQAAIRRGWAAAPDSSPIKGMFRSYYRSLFQEG